jgi:Ca-activated chloride channel family protein
MTLLWPGLFYCVSLVPLIILAYIWGSHRRSRYAVRMSTLFIVREAARYQSQWRRHLPFGFFLIALISLIVALCRPAITISMPSKQGIIVLALDVSRSMCSIDIQPTRLEALEATVSEFIAAQSSTTKIGVVAFSDFAELIQPPTSDKAAVDQAVNSLMTGWKRGIGDGIYKSLDVIAGTEGSHSSGTSSLQPTRPTGYAPAVIILVTNGANTVGPSPLDAARLAAERGIRIYTVGLSSPTGPVNTSCQTSDPSGFGREFQQAAAETSEPDVMTLQQIAALTGAEYLPASGLSGLENVFQDPQLHTILVSENVELTVVFIALAALFAMFSFLLVLLWSPIF